jgi:hypothetical protein
MTEDANEREYQGGVCPCGWDAATCQPYSSECFYGSGKTVTLPEPSNLRFNFGFLDLLRGPYAEPPSFWEHNIKPRRGKFRRRMRPDAPIIRQLPNGRPGAGSWHGGSLASWPIHGMGKVCAHMWAPRNYTLMLEGSRKPKPVAGSKPTGEGSRLRPRPL